VIGRAFPAVPDSAAGRETAMLPAFLSDVRIKTAPVPRTLDAATADGVLWQAAPGRFLLEVPRVAHFLVEDGRTVIIEPEPGSKAAEVSRFLGMTPLAALLYQRNVLAFHAAAAANSEGAVLLAGDSGAGKSTLLMALLQRGWTMLADELAAVDLDQHGEPRVWPTFPEVRLWQNARERAAKTKPAGNYRNLSMGSQFGSEARPLRAIYWLTVHNADRIEREMLQGMERFRAPGTLTYNSHIADVLLDRVEYMRRAAVIARLAVHRLRRPRGKWIVEELADQVEAA
jgi:hypothetical protein